MSRFTWTKKRSITTIILITILAVSSIGFWQASNNVQAAVLDPHPGLVGWWSFNEGSGTIAGDSSGNGNNGVITGATWVAGKYDQALNFNGINNYVNIPQKSSLSAPASLTVEAWFNPSTVVQSYQQIVGKQTGYNEYRLILMGNLIIGQIYDASHECTVNSADGGVYAQTGVWQHAALTYDGANLRLYVNGILVDTLALAITINPNTSPLGIGMNGGVNYPFNGFIDEVRIYNRALSATEIQQDTQRDPDFSSNVLAKVPTGTTQVIITLSWQGTASINATIVSPTQTYTELTQPVYQKTTYSTTDGISNMLNIKRISVPVPALPSDQNWNINLAFDNPVPYQITVEVQK